MIYPSTSFADVPFAQLASVTGGGIGAQIGSLFGEKSAKWGGIADSILGIVGGAGGLNGILGSFLGGAGGAKPAGGPAAGAPAAAPGGAPAAAPQPQQPAAA